MIEAFIIVGALSKLLNRRLNKKIVAIKEARRSAPIKEKVS